MTVDTTIANRLDELTDMGNRLLSRKQSGAGMIRAQVSAELAHQWSTSCLSLIARVCGKDSDHYIQFAKNAERVHEYNSAQRAKGVLNAFKEDYLNGALFDIRQLVRSEVFSDFFAQATHLFELGYYQTAAVIVGCVLEDALRKLCAKKGIILPAKPKLDSMNSELAKAGVYNTLTQKKVTALADLRNKAAHGNWSDFTRPDVEAMLRDVSSLVHDWSK
ncbi:MAG TPA: DUF4145 domain-containing protein [Nitrospira sp.]|nr:DUF4145 domain-containing protein [Nitrospira sp.]